MSFSEENYPKYVLFNRLISMQQWARAREVGQELLAVDPENHELLENLAQANIQLGNAEQGRRLAEKALQLNPDSHYALFLISLVQSDRNQDTQADESISRAIRFVPSIGASPLVLESTTSKSSKRRSECPVTCWSTRPHP